MADRTPPPDLGGTGPARAVLAVPGFRRIFFASFLSNTGRWMQQVVLGILAWELTESEVAVTRVIVAQFIPMLLLGLVGGAVADAVDRRKLLVVTQTWQAIWSFVLAIAVMDGEISQGTLLAIVFVIGVGQAFFAPAFSAVLPTLVDRRHLTTAISLNSTQMNASRVIGPALGAWMASLVGVSAVFVINAASYLFVIGALLTVTLPELPPSRAVGIERLLSGFRIAARARQIREPLLTMAAFSLFCLPFIGLMPAIAERNLGIDADSGAYGLLYACFGLGALVGAFSVGTVLVRLPKITIVRTSLVLFAAAIALLAALRTAWPAYPTILLVGLFYFTIPTTLTTYLQSHLSDEIRGRIMAMWMLSFAGMIPITNLVAGPVAEATSVSFVLGTSAIAALSLAAVVRLAPGGVVGDEILEEHRGEQLRPEPFPAPGTVTKFEGTGR